MFQPRMLSGGSRICCSHPGVLCKACREHHNISYHPSLAKGIDDHVAITTEWHGEHLRTACTCRELPTKVQHREDTNRDWTPPDPYAAGIAALRAAESTPESRFAERYAEMRRRELQMAADAVFTPLRLTAAQEVAIDELKIPDPYAAGIKALQSKGAR